VPDQISADPTAILASTTIFPVVTPGSPNANEKTTLAAVTTYLATTFVPVVRTVSTSSPLAGGGVLSGNLTLSLTQSAVDHGSIGGLVDDDHAQYALLLGRAGQTLALGTLTAGPSAGVTLHVQGTTNAAVESRVETTSAGTAGAAVVRAASATANVFVESYGSGHTGTLFGITLATYGSVHQVTGNGLLVGTSGATPLVLGTNNVERARFDSNGLLLVPTMHNATGSTGTAQAVSSGTYTPTVTGVLNVAAVANARAQWMRVGSVVTVSGAVDIDPTATSTATNYTISLPIASNLTNAGDLSGTMAFWEGPVTTVIAAPVRTNTTSDVADVVFTSASAAASTTNYFVFTYIVK
jgi:hypothetical protein